MQYRVQVVIRNQKHSWWRIKAKNGQTLLVSEVYKNKAACLRVAEQLQSKLLGSSFKVIDQSAKK